MKWAAIAFMCAVVCGAFYYGFQDYQNAKIELARSHCPCADRGIHGINHVKA